jgi:hypothetical protein
MKVDHTKILGNLYNQSKKEISLVEVPPMNFLTIQGSGSPNQSQAYSDAVGALYAVAYKIKFSIKKGPLALDYKVMPLEGLWWAEDMRKFNLEERDNWLWQMMLMQPEEVTKQIFEEAREEVRRKKNPPRLDEVKFEAFEEGACAQIFHSGPYGEAEAPSIEKLHAFIHENGYALSGKHHEIYFNSPLRTAPEKLKTIIRQPMQKAAANG